MWSRGVSTLEILIAAAILSLSLTAIITVIFGNQSLAADTETNDEAISKAQALLEQARANAREDFNLVNPTSGTQTNGPITYTNTLAVQSVDLFTKQATSTISWQAGGRTLRVLFSTLLTNPSAVGGGDTCSSVLAGNWANPQMTSYQMGQDLLSDPSSDYLINAVDVYDNKLYVAANITHGNNQNTFFIFNLPTPTTPTILSQIDNDPSTTAGLNGMRVFGDYAYAANAAGSNFSTCVSGTCGQLQIINVASNPPTPILKYKVPGVMGSGNKSIGTSVFYKNGIVYLGLAKTPDSNPGGDTEFNAIDVGGGGLGGTPTDPKFIKGYQVGNGVNSIFVDNKYAYIVSPNSENITILNADVHSSNFMQRVSGYTPTGGANGESVYVVGTKIYLGRTFGTNELYVLNGQSLPGSISQSGFKDIGTGNTTSINGLVIRDYLAFLITGNNFQVWNISNPSLITPWSPAVPFPNQGGGSSPGTATDCEGNYFYVGSLPSGNQKGNLSIIGPGP